MRRPAYAIQEAEDRQFLNEYAKSRLMEIVYFMAKRLTEDGEDWKQTVKWYVTEIMRENAE